VMNFGKSLEGIGRGVVEVGLPFRNMLRGTVCKCETIRLARDPRQNAAANVSSPQ